MYVWLFMTADQYVINYMQDHEQSLIDAIARLPDLSDGQSGKNHWIVWTLIGCCLMGLFFHKTFGAQSTLMYPTVKLNFSWTRKVHNK